MTIAVRPQVVESPCSKVCTVDAASGLCIGCGRNLAEIAGWLGMSAVERAQIMAILPQRLEQMRRHADPAGR